MSVLRDYARVLSQPPLAMGGSEASVARYDEVVAPDGTLRPAWQPLAERALALRASDVRRLDGEISRQLADDGVSYGTGGLGSQPWRLDPLPLVLDAETWAPLEIGLAQRAELLNAILVDLSGDRALLATGTIPAPVIVGHAGFARPLARASVDDPHPLVLAAADLGRGADGRWHVLADRVQAPSGLGYAMQNRRVLARVIPDLAQAGDVHRLEPYFAALRGALAAAAPDGVDDPRIVVLSPGSHSETAFDQAFLASALGIPLVRGGDLTVAEGALWMKPAGWPERAPRERVHVVLRRVDASWCDPLELRSDSQLGVPGLADVARRGRVALVNSLASGVLENPGLLPYLPAACELLLGEELRLPSIPSRWLGDEAAREALLPRIAAGDAEIVVRTIDGDRLPPDPALAARIARAPERFVVQEPIELSQAPVWPGEHEPDGPSARPQPLSLRTFVLRYHGAYRPLAGGLATIRDAGPDAPRHAVAAPVTKDVWVRKAAPDEPDQGLEEETFEPVLPTAPALPPRALDDLFWAGRYAERAEDLLRLLLVVAERSEGADRLPSAAESLRRMRAAVATFAEPRFDDPDVELRSLLLDVEREDSVAFDIARLRDALEGVRDQLSSDTWRVFATTGRAQRSLRAAGHPHRAVETGGRILTALLALHGVTTSMIRDAAWHAIEAGRFLERTLQICRLLLSSIATDPPTARAERAVVEAMLQASESAVTHRRRFRGVVRAADASRFLLIDDENPRSALFSLQRALEHVAALPASTGSTRPERMLRERCDALAELGRDAAGLDTALAGGRAELEALLTSLVLGVEEVATALSAQQFESGPPPLALSDLALIEHAGSDA